MRRSASRILCVGIASFSLLFPGRSTTAATVYWDINGTNAGAADGGAGTASGTWDSTNTFWNPLANGTGATAAWIAGDIAAFSAGTGATQAFTVTISGTQSIGGLLFEEGTVTLSGGTLSLAASSNIDVAANLTATIASVIDGTSLFNLTKTGSGTLVLDGANTYAGRTLINAGILSISADANLGAAPAGVTSDSITFGGGTLRVTGTGNPTINANRGIFITAGVTGTLEISSSANSVIYGGVISGVAGTTFKKTGAGTLELQGDSSATLLGALNIDGGVLKLSGNGALAGTTGVTLGNRGTFTLDNGATNVGNRTAGAFASSGGTINFIANTAATTETLGALTLNAGALTINSTTGAGGSTLTIPTLTRSVVGGTLYMSGTGLGGATHQIVLGTAPALVNSVLRYAVISDGTLTSFASYTTSAGTNQSVVPLALASHNQGAETTWTATSNARPTADLPSLTGAARSVFTLTLDSGIDITAPLTSDRTITIGGAVLQTGGVSIVAASGGTLDNILAFGTNEAIFHILGSLQLDRGNATTLTGTGGFTKSGAGTLILNGVSSLTGAFNVNEGILEVRAATSLMATAATINLNGATLRLSNDTGTTYTGNLLVNADSTIQVDRVTAAATATTHTLGTLSIGNGRTLSVISNDITSGTAYGLTFSGALTLTGAATLDVANNGAGLGTLTVSTISGAFPLTKTGAGDLMLSNVAGVYNGFVDIQAGRVGWSPGSGTLTEATIFAGAGGLLKSGNGAVTLTGTSTFTGGITVTGGTLNFSTVSNNGGSASNLGQGTGGIVLNGGTLSFIGATSQSTNRAISITASSTLNAGGTGGATITYAGAITAGTDFALTLTGTGSGSITGGITQVGTAADLNINSGTWTLSGTPTAIADDVILTGATAVLNLNSTGVLGYLAGTSNGLYARSGAIINLNVNDVTGVAAAGGNDFIFLGDVGVGTLNTNGFNVTTLRLDIGDDDALIDSGIVTGTGILTVTTDMNFYRGTIAANLAGAGTIEKLGTGDVTLSGDNSGLTTAAAAAIVYAGNLILDYTASNTTKLAVTNSLDMRGGTLTVNGNATADTSQSVLSLVLSSAAGWSTINVNRAGTQSATLNLGAITRTTGTGTIQFGLPASGAITTTTGNLGTTGVLGGWATVKNATGTYFAANDGSNNIVAVATTTKNNVASWADGDHITDDTTGFTGTLGNVIGVNTLRFNAAGPSTVTIGTGLALGVGSGGILQTSSVTAGNSLITGGRLVSGASSELIFTTDSATQILEVSSLITGAQLVTKTGAGTLKLSGANNNYTGTTRLLSGTLQVSGGKAIGDTSAVTINATQNSVLELLNSETIGTLSGGASANLVLSELRLNGNTLTINQASSGTFSGAFTGTASSSLIKNGAGNLQLTTNVNSMAGTVTVNQGLFYLSGSSTMVNVTAFTVNKGGSLMIDNNGTTTSGNRIADTATITLNSADGAWSGETRPSGLAIRRDQGSTQSETVGVLTLNSGASYTRLEATVTSAFAQIITDDITRLNKATLDVRGTNMSATTGQRAQLRIGTAGNQTNFINAMVGGGSTTLGTKNISIVPWAIAEEFTSGIADANMGNSLATYVSGQGFRALNLTTEYNTYTASAIATENIRENLAASLTGLSGKTINALVINNSNTAANTLSFTGSGAGQTLAVTSGTMLFTATGAVTGTPAMGITLGGFDGGITVGATNEYVIFVQNPTSAAASGLVTATIDSQLTSTADITKSGRGTLILTAANTAGGNSRRTTINEGVLQISNLGNIGGSTGDLVFAGGTLKLGTGFVDDISTRTITFLQGGGTLDTNGNDVTFAGSLGSGSGGFTKAGVGNLTLNAATTLTGTTTINAGTVTLGASQAIGTGVLTVSGGSTLAMGANNATVAGLTVSNAANVISGTGTLTVNGEATVSRGTISPLLAGSMNLTKLTASQTVTLSNTANTFTGYVHVQDGTLSIASIANAGVASSLGAGTGENAAIRLGNAATTGILLYTGSTASTDRLFSLQGTTGGGTIDNDGTGALTLTGVITGAEYGTKTITLQGASTGFTNVASGVISNGLGIVGVTKAEAGTWSLTGTNTYSGATTINAGTLVFANLSNLGTGTTITMGGGALRWATGNTVDISTRTVAFTNNAIFDTNGNDVTFANAVGGTAAFGITKTGAGTLTLAGNYTYTGAHVVTAGTLTVTGTAGTTGNVTVANAVGNAVLNITNGSTLNGGTITVGTATGAVGAVNITGGTLNMVTGETTDTISFGAANGGYGALNMTGGTFTQARFMFGGTSATSAAGGIGVGLVSGGTVNTNGYIILARNGASTGVLTITGGTINHTSASQNLNLGWQGTGRAELNVAGGLIDNTGRNVVFGGGSWTGTGILNLNAGTLLTNAITRSSGTASFVNFNGGTLKAAADGAALVPVMTSTTVTVNGAFGTYAGGAVIDTNGFNVTAAANFVAPTGNGVSTITVADGGSGYIGAPYVSISGGTGATAIANMVDDGTGNGTLKVGSITVTNPGNGYTGTPTYTLTGGGPTVAATPGTVTTSVNTSGGFTKLGAGTLTLSGTNTFTGAVNVNGGTLAFSTNANLGDASQVTNTIGVNGGTLSYTGAGALDLGANRALTIGSGGATLDVTNAAAALTFSAGASAPSMANLVKTGAGSVILSGNTNLNGGSTTVNGGLLRTGFGTNGTNAINVAAGAVLQNVTATGSTLVLSSTGSLTLSAGADLATASNLGFGLNGSTASGITLSAGGTLVINGSGKVFIDLLSLGSPLSATTYTLLSAPGGGLLTGTTGAVTYELDDVVGGYTYTLNQSATQVSVTVGLFSGTLYWHGDLTGPAGSWLDYRAGDTNWLNNVTGGTDQSIIPGALTTVVFGATEATGPVINTTLDGDVTIKHLQFTSNPTGVTAVTIAQGTGGSLTIAPALSTNGIDVGDNAGIITISAPVVASKDQTWNVSSVGTPSLSLTGGLSGSGDIIKTGAGALTIGGVNSIYNGDLIWSGGALTITPTGTGANSLVFNGVISGSGTGPLLKNGAGILALNGANTYTGGTTLDGGTTILGNKQAFGAGTVTTSTNVPTLQASVALTGVNKVTNAFVLDTNLTVSGANSLELGGTTTTSTNHRTITNNLTGPATLTLSGNVILGEAGFARNLTVNGTGATFINGVVSNGGAAGGWLVKGSGTGTLTLGAANTYTGFTIVDQGSMILAAGVNQSMTNTFYFGSSSGASTAGTLDLSNASATFTVSGTNLAFWNQINSTTNTPAILIGAGQSLNLNGSVRIGNDSAASTTTLMTASGLGTINITNLNTNGSFRVGGYAGTTGGQGNRASADLSGLATLNVSLNTTTGTMAVSNNTSANTADKYSTLILAATTTVTARTLAVGDGGANAGPGQVNSLKLGSVANNFNVDILNIGTGMRDLGSVTFNTSTGTVNIHGVASPTTRTAFNMGTTGGGTGVTGADGNTFDVTGHTATLMFGAVAIGTQNRGHTLANTFSFNQGTLDMTSLTLSTRSANASTGTGPFSTTSTVNLGGGDVDIQSGILQAGQVSGGTNAHVVTATINISGSGTVDIGNTSGTSIQMANVATAAGTATSTINVSGGTTTLTGGITMATATTAGGSATGSINLTGGIFTVGGNIIRGGGAGTSSATVTLNGGTLGMAAKNMGDAINLVTFVAQKGTLRNLAELNGGGTLTKTGSATDTLVMEGSNTYTGVTAIDGGILQVNSAAALGGTGTIRFGGGTLQYTANNNVDYGTRIQNSTSAIKLDTNGQDITITGSLNVSNTAGLTKRGAGSLKLAAANLYGGDTIIESGVLVTANTAALSTGNVIINSGSILAVGDNTLLTGQSVNVAQNLTLSSGGTLTFDIFSNSHVTGNTHTNTTDNDYIVLTGATPSISLDGIIQVVNATPLGASSFNIGDRFWLFDWDALITTPNFTGTPTFDFASFGTGGVTFDTSKLMTDGYIQVTSVPEPSRALLLVAGLSLTILRRRRKS